MLGPLLMAGASLAGNLLGQRNQASINNQNMWAQNLQNEANRQAAVANQERQIAHTTDINQQNLAFQREANAASMAQADRLNAMALADKDKDRQLQADFAQMGIKWRVEDAERAGVHPLFALGGGGAAYSPSAISLSGGSTTAPQFQAASLGSLPPGVASRSVASNSFANMGQDLSRALLATQTMSTRNDAFEAAHQDLMLKNLSLKNDLLSSQIARAVNTSAPGGPSVGDFSAYPSQETKEAQTTPFFYQGRNTVSNPMSSDAQTAEDRYGEVGGFFLGMDNMMTDLHNNPGAAFRWWQKVNSMMVADQFRNKFEALEAGRHPSQWLEQKQKYKWGGWKSGMVPMFD